MRTKPKLPVLQRGHPLARGLVGAWPMTEGSGATTRDAANRHTMTLTGTGTTWISPPAIDLSATGRYLRHSTGIPFAGTGNITFFWYGTLVTNTFGNPGFIRDGSTSNGGNFFSLNGSTAGRPWIRWNGNDILKPTTGETMVIDQLATCAYVVIPGEWAGWYLNGRLEHSTTHAQTSGNYSIYNIGYQSAGNENARGYYHAAYLWRRALVAAEIHALHLDPYAMFRPPTSMRLAALVATPLPTIIVRLTWQDNASDEDGYKIERSTDGSSFAQIGTVAAHVTQYDDETANRDETYYYRVRAYNDNGDSDYSDVVQITTDP